MNTDLLFVALFWGVWLFIPAIIDGFSTLWQFWVSLQMLRQQGIPPLPEDNLPKVSVIIPAHNEEKNIGYCLLSLRAQTYPHSLIEIIVVDDGSTDRTCDVVLYYMGNRSAGYLRTNSFTVVPKPFGGVLNLIRKTREGNDYGKPAALNTGLGMATGEIMITLDSDVVLEPDALEQAVRSFLAKPDLVAATGHLIVDPYLVLQRTQQDDVVMDERGVPAPKPLSLSERILTACQFLEYVTAFHLGRRTEGFTDSMFTMSGACTVLRRDTFQQIGKLRGRTVSEDADLTMALHSIPDKQVGYLPAVRVHLMPVLTWSELYSQRTRWQRGALEVGAIHHLMTHNQRGKWHLWKVALPLRLQIDHTLAMPRLVWTFLIWMLPVFGYSGTIVIQAFTLMVLFYIGISILRTLVAYLFSAAPEKIFVRKYMAYLALWPFYNAFLFWVRMSAEIRTLTEGAEWNVETPLLQKLESGQIQRRLAQAVRLWLSAFT
jgi:poly-beta-1,6-N-acetyl-D-glucosamine synthase